MSTHNPAEHVRIGKHELEGLLTIPDDANSLATLQFDLLNDAEAADKSNIFDIDHRAHDIAKPSLPVW